MGKYKVLIIDDNNQRKSIYNKMFLDEAQDQNTFELFYASESFEEFLEKKDKEDYHLYVVDLTLVWNGTKENNLENTFRKVLQTIGNRKPIILLSAEFNNNANWINDECLKYNIIHIISWDKAKNDREVRSNLRTNIIFVLDKTYNYSKMTKLDNDPVRILHLSDLQFDCNDIIKKDKSEIYKTQLKGFLSNQDNKIDFIVITGDITEHSLPCEFEIGRKWIYELTEPIFGKEYKERILLVNGNHDYNLSIGALNFFEFKYGSSPMEMINHNRNNTDYQEIAFYPYKVFLEEATGQNCETLTFYNNRFAYLGVNFLHLNTLEIYSPKISNAGESIFGIKDETFEKIINNSNSKLFTIILSHADIDSLKNKVTAEAHSVWDKLRSSANQFNNSLLLMGHKHLDTELKKERIGDNNNLYHVTAPTLLSKPELPGIKRGFNIVTLHRESSIVKKITSQVFSFNTHNRIIPEEVFEEILN